MESKYRSIMAPLPLPAHGALQTPPATTTSTSDIRTTPRMGTGPMAGFDLSGTKSEPREMEKTPPITGKRRGGNRKACNECKQQKVSFSGLDPPPELV
jgi:hypothetical protein